MDDIKEIIQGTVLKSWAEFINRLLGKYEAHYLTGQEYERYVFTLRSQSSI